MDRKLTLKEMAAKVAKAFRVEDMDVSGKFIGLASPMPYEYEMRVNGKTISLYCDSFLFFVEDITTGKQDVCNSVSEVFRAVRKYAEVKEAA